jgi:hypothetical protein
MIESRRVRWSGHVVCMVEMRNVYTIGKTKGKRPLGRPSHRWEANISMDLMEIGLDSFGS